VAAAEPISSDQFAPGWQTHAKSLFYQGPTRSAGRDKYEMPGILPVGEYVLVSRKGDKAHLIDGQRITVRSGNERQFVFLDAGAGDVQALGYLTTPDMLRELLPMLTARTAGASRTDVITLHAELVGLEELGAAYLASVEFSGLIRESAEQGAVPFRELWMLACEKDGSPSWRLARQQALF